MWRRRHMAARADGPGGYRHGYRARGKPSSLSISLCRSRLGAAMAEHDLRARAFSFFSNDFYDTFLIRSKGIPSQ